MIGVSKTFGGSSILSSPARKSREALDLQDFAAFVFKPRPKPGQKPITFKVDRTVTQCCSLEFVLVVIFLFGEVFDEVYMFSVAYIDGAGGLPIELMEMFIGKVCMKFYFVDFNRY